MNHSGLANLDHLSQHRRHLDIKVCPIIHAGAENGTKGNRAL
ncbi:MAG: hypothetical protein AAF478_13075 [Pseudomonadota bacterium]